MPPAYDGEALKIGVNQIFERNKESTKQIIGVGERLSVRPVVLLGGGLLL